MTPYDYPQDEFDTPDDGRVPVGVHRAPTPAWHQWVPLLAVIFVVPLLAWGAVTLLAHRGTDDGSSTTPSLAAATASASAQATEEATAPEGEAAAATQAPEQEAQPTPTPEESADMTTGVTIHNGTSTSGMAGRTGDRLRNAGYTNVTVPQGQYTNEAPSVTTVYYAAEANEATARAIAQTLGISTVELSPTEAESNPIVIVLRSDFTE